MRNSVMLLVGFFWLLAPVGLLGQASRTFVSGVGDDANPCSRTAPCKTFAGAISKTTANGEISVLDSGGFGSVTITKSITIDGKDSLAGILASGTTGIVIAAGASGVVSLRNLAINGGGTGIDGIRIDSAAAVNVENVEIFGFTDRGIEFLPTVTSRLFVKDSLIRRNSGQGIFIAPAVGISARASVNGTRLENNSTGLRANDRSTVTVSQCLIDGNVGHGLQLFSSADAATMTVANSVITQNGGGNLVFSGIFCSGSASLVNVTDTAIINNSTGFSSSTCQIISFGNNQVTGNLVNGSPTGTAGES